MSDLQVQAELKLKDNLSKPAGTALDSLGKNAKKAVDAVDAVGRADSVKRVARDATEAARGMDAVARGAREAQSGLRGAERGATGLARAMHGVGRGLRDAVGQMQKLRSGLGKGWQAAAAVGASGMAAKATIQRPVDKEQQLLYDATVAFGERKDAASIRAGVTELRALDAAAVKYGGGTNDSAMETRGMLFGQGIDFETTKTILPGIQRTATATNSSGADLAQTVAAGLKARQFSKEDAEEILGMMANAGSAGSFETKDMGQYLPGIFASAPDMLGKKGTAYHLANLELMRDASGSSAEAATLYTNLQSFRNSPEAYKNLKKKKVNLAKVYQKAAAGGEDMNLAFVDAIQKGVVEKDKLYRTLSARMEKAQATERDALQRQLSARQSQLFGQIIGDTQARRAAVAMANGGERRNELLEAVQTDPSATVSKFFEVVTTSTQSKFNTLGNAWDTAMDGFFANVKGKLDSALGWTADTMTANPTASVGLAGTAAVGGSVAAGGAAFSFLEWLRGGKAVPTPPAGTAVDAAAEGVGAAGGSAAAAGGKGAALLKGAAKAGSVLAVAGSAIDAVSTELDDSLTRAQKNEAHTETAGGLAGALAGGKAGAIGGAALGSFLGPIGTAIGGAIGGLGGGIAGYFGGSWVGKKLGGWFFGDDDEAAPAPQPENGAQNAPDIARTVLQAAQIMQNQPLAATLNIQLEMDGEVIARKVEQVQLRQATRR